MSYQLPLVDPAGFLRASQFWNLKLRLWTDSEGMFSYCEQSKFVNLTMSLHPLRNLSYSEKRLGTGVRMVACQFSLTCMIEDFLTSTIQNAAWIILGQRWKWCSQPRATWHPHHYAGTLSKTLSKVTYQVWVTLLVKPRKAARSKSAKFDFLFSPSILSTWPLLRAQCGFFVFWKGSHPHLVTLLELVLPWVPQ